MAPGVVADKVAGLCDAARQLALSFREFAQHEECGMHIVFGKNVQQARCPRRIGAIVEGKGQLSRPSRSDESAAENLRGRPTRSVGVAPDAKAGHPSDTD